MALHFAEFPAELQRGFQSVHISRNNTNPSLFFLLKSISTLIGEYFYLVRLNKQSSKKLNILLAKANTYTEKREILHALEEVIEKSGINNVENNNQYFVLRYFFKQMFMLKDTVSRTTMCLRKEIQEMDAPVFTAGELFVRIDEQEIWGNRCKQYAILA